MSEEKHKGTIIAISPLGSGSQKEHTSVLIRAEEYSSWDDSQRWFNVARNVDPKYIKKGECEYTLNPENEITFLKMTGGFNPANNYKGYKSGGYKKSYGGQTPEDTEWLKQQGCMNLAIQLLNTSGQLGIKVEGEVNDLYSIAKDFAKKIYQDFTNKELKGETFEEKTF